MAKKVTVEQRIMEGHKERVQGLTAYTMFIMQDVCEKELDRVIAFNAAKSLVENWLSSEVEDDEDEEEKKKEKEN